MLDFFNRKPKNTTIDLEQFTVTFEFYDGTKTTKEVKGYHFFDDYYNKASYRVQELKEYYCKSEKIEVEFNKLVDTGLIKSIVFGPIEPYICQIKE